MAVENSALLLLSATHLLVCTFPFPSHTHGYSTKIQSHAILDLSSGPTDHLIAVDIVASSICVASGNKIWISIDRANETNFSQAQFSWKQLVNPNQVTAIACFGDTVAVGEQSGSIRIYFEVSGSSKTGQLPNGSLISWHQSPVSSLQISNNGT